MMSQILLGVWVVSVTGVLIILIVLGIPVLLIVLLVRYILRNKKENIRLRLEVGKLADELEQARKQAENVEKNDSSVESK